MAAPHWRTGHTLEQLYVKPGVSWSFYQLIRLLQNTGQDEEAQEQLLAQNIRFSAPMAQDFPPDDIRRVSKIEAHAEGESSVYEISHIRHNLAGIDGPLAEPFIEMMREAEDNGNYAMRAFFEIFNQRFQAHSYMLRAKIDNGLTTNLAQNTDFGRFHLALCGVSATEGQLSGLDHSDVMGLAGQLANGRVSFPLVRELFLRLMQLTLSEMTPNQGAWLALDRQDHCRLGQQNQRLGTEAALGTRVWDQMAAVQWSFTDVAPQRLLRLTPGGEEFPRLQALLRWISQGRYSCKVTLISAAKQHLPRHLSSSPNKAPSLGWTCYLGEKPAQLRRVSFQLNAKGDSQTC